MYFKRTATPITSDPPRLQFAMDRFECESVRLLKVLDNLLAGQDFICGGGKGCFKLDDIACYGYAESHWWAGINMKRQNLLNFLRWLPLLRAKESILVRYSVPGVSNCGSAIRKDASRCRTAIKNQNQCEGQRSF